MRTYKPKTKPFPHQVRAMVRAVKKRNYAIFMEPRLGKSKTAIDVANIWALKSESDDPFKVLVVAPKIALSVWEEQLEQHCTLDYSAENFTEYWGDGESFQWFLAGAEETWRAERTVKKLVRNKQEVLESFDPDLIIFDESHRYKRPGSRGAQDAWRMVRRLRKRRGTGLPYVLLLSGTPNPKGWRDLFAQFRIMDEDIFGTNAENFDDEYCVYGKGARRFSVVSYRHEKQLIRIARKHSMAVSAAEAGLAGNQTWTSIKVTLPNAASQLYQNFATDMLSEFQGREISAKNAGVKRLRLLQIAGGFLTDGTVVHREKVRAAKEWCRLLFEQGEPVIVYCRFLPEVHAVGEVVESLGYRTWIIEGATRDLDRRRAVAAFQRSRGSRPVGLVFQVQTGSMAIELSGGAETVYYSTPDGWVDYWQSLNRTLGPNQKRPVRYTHLLARGTVDVSAMAGLRKKEDWHQTMMRNPRRYLLGMI